MSTETLARRLDTIFFEDGKPFGFTDVAHLWKRSGNNIYTYHDPGEDLTMYGRSMEDGDSIKVEIKTTGRNILGMGPDLTKKATKIALMIESLMSTTGAYHASIAINNISGSMARAIDTVLQQSQILKASPATPGFINYQIN